MGHSSILVNFFGVTILLDPVFSSRASPVPFTVGRFQKAVVSLEDLPSIDFVLISHDHYDHLDMNTVQYFINKKTKFLVPLGVAPHLKGWGIDPSQIKEFDWWDKYEVRGVKFIATPAQHFSGRGIFEKNKSLWSGWSISNKKQKIFFSGDSGYDIHFKEIGRRLGPFDIVFLDSGQYNLLWRRVPSSGKIFTSFFRFTS